MLAICKISFILQAILFAFVTEKKLMLFRGIDGSFFKPNDIQIYFARKTQRVEFLSACFHQKGCERAGKIAQAFFNSFLNFCCLETKGALGKLVEDF